MLRQYVVSPSPVFPVFLVAGGTFGGILFYGVVAFLLGQLDVSTLYLIRVAALSAVYNAILTPLLFPSCAGWSWARAPARSSGGDASVTDLRAGTRLKVLADSSP